MDKPASPWETSDLQSGAEPTRVWGHAHDLVNMYLGIAHLADSELDPEEQRVFLRKFGQWEPEVTIEEFERIWGEVLALYESVGSRENRYALYLQSIINIARRLGESRERLRAIIRDLVDIASADGTLHENEVTMIKAAAIAYGMSADLRINSNTGQVEVTIKDAN